MTDRFVRQYLSRVFDNPGKVFTEEILRPEKQDSEAFIDGVLHIAEAQQKVAQRYLDDGSIALACPPLQAILTIMAKGSWNGFDAASPQVRQMFTREALLQSDWYRQRLRTKQERDVEAWGLSVEALEKYLHTLAHDDVARELSLPDRLQSAKQQLAHAGSDEYLKELVGTIGADPMEPIDAARAMQDFAAAPA